MCRSALTVVVGVALTVGVAAQEDSSASELLRRMMRAEMTQKLSGTRVVIVNLEGKSERVIEIVLRSGPNTRVEFPKGSPRHGEVIVERGPHRWHWVPGENTIYVGDAKRPDRVGRGFHRVLEGVRRGMLHLEAGDSVRVAGRKCTELVLKRKDGAIAWKLAVDDATGLLLKQQIFDPTNPRRVIGGFEYTQLDLGVQPTEEDFVIRRQGAKVVRDDFVPVEQAQKRVPFRILLPDPAPSGLKLAGAKPVELGGKAGVHLLYHDQHGIVPVSVFQVRGEMPKEALRRHRDREFRVATRQVGETFLAAVGKMSQERLQGFVNSFR